ncbi:MAG: 4'-phosphopantetheinyl transferase superfamily protein, partial [Candidatus Poseidoniia archaeon]
PSEIYLARVSVNTRQYPSHTWRAAQYSAGREALAIASLAYGLDCKKIVFKIVNEDGGKLIGTCGNALASASIAHTDSIALAVVGSEGFSIGIDVEDANRIVGPDVLRYIASEGELATSSSLPSNAEMLAVWTKKEAITKATGYGLVVAKEIQPIDRTSWSWKSRIFTVVNWNFEYNIRSYNISLAVESGQSCTSSLT